MKITKRLYLEYILSGLAMLAFAAGILCIPNGLDWNPVIRIQLGLAFLTIVCFSWFSCTYTRRRIDRIHAAVNRLIENLPQEERKDIVFDPKNYTPEYFLEKLIFIEEHYERIISRLKVLISRSEETNRQLRKTAVVKKSILDLTRELMDLQNTTNLFDLILGHAMDTVENADAGSVLLVSEDGKVRFAASRGFNHEMLKTLTLDLKDTFLWGSTKGNIQGPVVIESARTFNEAVLDPHLFNAFEKSSAMNFKTTLSAPVLVSGKLYGMVNVDSNKQKAFCQEDIRLMDYFASQAGLAIKNRQLLEEFYRLSRYDDLTGLYNRRHFEDLLVMDIHKASRYEVPFLIALFDLDNLKEVNDTYGHLAGDRCLAHFAKHLKGLVRKQDLVARYGGDEFIASFYKCTWQDLILRIEEFRAHFEQNPCPWQETEIPITFSYGLAEFPEDGTSYEALLEEADKILYQAKSRIKSRSGGKANDSPEGTAPRSE